MTRVDHQFCSKTRNGIRARFCLVPRRLSLGGLRRRQGKVRVSNNFTITAQILARSSQTTYNLKALIIRRKHKNHIGSPCCLCLLFLTSLTFLGRPRPSWNQSSVHNHNMQLKTPSIKHKLNFATFWIENNDTRLAYITFIKGQ